MDLFGKKPQERAMASLIHDTNRTLDYRGQDLKQLEKWINDNEKKLQESGLELESIMDIVDCIGRITRGYKKIEDSIDAYYTKFKNDFPEIN